MQLNGKAYSLSRTYPKDWLLAYFADEPVGLKHRAVNSMLWTLAQMFLQRGLQLATTAVLAHYLFPADFGLLGMAQIVMGIVALFGNYGLGAAIVQRKDVNQIHLATAYWFSAIAGVTLYLLCLLASPLAIWYFKNPHVGPVLSVMALGFLIGATSGVQGTILTKQLRFKALSVINLMSGAIGSLVSLLLVVGFAFGYWGIIVGSLVSSAFAAAAKWYTSKWVPLWVFDPAAFKELFHFGKNLFLGGLVNYFKSNVDYLIIGRLLGVANLGLYLFAYEIPHVVLREFSQATTGILFPVLCRVTDDPDRFNRGYLKALRLISLVSFPASVGLFSVASHFIHVVYGERWLGAILPLQILCFSGMPRSVLTTMGTIFNSKGRPDIELKWNCVTFVMVVAAALVGARYGIIGVAWAMMITSYLSFVAMWSALRLAGIGISDYVQALVPAGVGSLLIVLAVGWMDEYLLAGHGLSHFSLLVVEVVTGILVYGGYLMLVHMELIKESMTLIRGGIKAAE